MIVSKKISFDAAHYLPDYPGKCRNMHGHRWTVEVAVLGDVSIKNGMVVDFTHLGKFLKLVEGILDHKVINEVIPDMIPTAENIADWVKQTFLAYQFRTKALSKVTLYRIKVWETEDSCALVEG